VLNKNDLKEIEGLLTPLKKEMGEVKEEITEMKQGLAANTASVIKIEGKIDVALELRKDVVQVREQVKDHEERISNLEI